jgi:hypothetical protein
MPQVVPKPLIPETTTHITIDTEKKDQYGWFQNEMQRARNNDFEIKPRTPDFALPPVK